MIWDLFLLCWIGGEQLFGVSVVQWLGGGSGIIASLVDIFFVGIFRWWSSLFLLAGVRCGSLRIKATRN